MDKLTLPKKDRQYNDLFMESSRWDNFITRDDDILICSPAKCGTTWTQMICALLIFQKTELDQPLTEFSPWLDVLLAPITKVLKQLDDQTHRRFIKTHTPLDGLPYFEKSKYICVGRDPRDAFISLKHHMGNMNMEAMAKAMANATHEVKLPPPTPEDPREWFTEWITSSCGENTANTAHADVLYYARSFWSYRDLPNILMLHFSDLKADLEGEMKRVAEFLEIEVPPALWPELVNAASFENMKSKAKQLAPQVTDNLWKDTDGFFNKGTSGQWRDILGDKELELYKQAMEKNLAPELAHWLENGRLESS